eukprot:834734-Pyramimonas_sp.AAC.1
MGGLLSAAGSLRDDAQASASPCPWRGISHNWLDLSVSHGDGARTLNSPLRQWRSRPRVVCAGN